MDTKKKAVLLSGEKIGRWTLISKENDNGNIKWLCRCDCGTERLVQERSLRYGGSTSCGCLRRERAAEALTEDLTGRQFGELTVIKKLGSDGKGRGVRWLCSCSCGAEYEVQGTLLLTGRRTRCPSGAHQKNYSYTDISGRQFGRLTALYPSRRNDRSGSVIWRCRCRCGNEVDLSYNSLVYCNQKSCGCQKKEHSEKLATYLTHMAGTSVEMLRSKKIPTDNTTGCKGVYLIRGKYVAKIVFQKKAYYLGTFDTMEEAALARKNAEAVLFDAVADHCQRWKEIANKNPGWAEENPIEITVIQNEDKQLNVLLQPDLTNAAQDKTETVYLFPDLLQRKKA